MQAASRDALALARERLHAVSGDADRDTLSALADEMFAAGRLLIREPALRRALSDPARRDADRVGFGDEIFGGRVGEATQEVLRTIVGARWSAPFDLVDACELIGVQALLMAAERDDALADVEDELFRVSRIIDGDPQLAAVLSDGSAPAERREALAAELLEGKADAVTVRLVRFSVFGLGGAGFDSSLDRLVELAAARRDRSVVRVRVASPISADQQDGLADVLGRAYRRQMSLQVEVDESLLGGAVVRIADDLYDGSIARALADARHELIH